VREGGLALTGSVKSTIHSTNRPVRALSHLVPEGTDARSPFWLNNGRDVKERKGMAPADCAAVPAPEPCALVPKSRKEESARAGKDVRGMGFS
jgi:hypothetical protein